MKHTFLKSNRKIKDTNYFNLTFCCKNNVSMESLVHYTQSSINIPAYLRFLSNLIKFAYETNGFEFIYIVTKLERT